MRLLVGRLSACSTMWVVRRLSVSRHVCGVSGFAFPFAPSVQRPQQQQQRQRRRKDPGALFSTTETDTDTPAPPTERLWIGGESVFPIVDARTVTDQLELVLSHLEARRAGPTASEAARQIAELSGTRNGLIQSKDKALNVRKTASETVGRLKRQQASSSSDGELDSNEMEAQLEEAVRTSNEAAEEARVAEESLAEVQSTIDELLLSLPNLLDDRVPDGDDDSDNELVAEWGDPERLPQTLGWTADFEPQWHDTIAAALGGWKAEEAVAMSGSRFVALTGPVARLNRAIASFFLDLHTTQHGYTEASVPLIVSASSLVGTSQLPKFKEDLFAIAPESHTCNGEPAYLVPTAEVPLTNLHRNDGKILDASDLPLSYVALTPCFRAEAGSYGRDTRGLVRTHQFEKVELVKICAPDTSDDEHELLTSHARACLEALALPYRMVRLCSGDIGFSARHCYDLEVWLPGQQTYREISSCSNTGDFQARRMGLRYRPDPVPDTNNNKKPKKPKPQFCHTLNGSGLAVGRTLVAILENYQCPDGSVVIPEVLRPYMGGMERMEPVPQN